ncbi:hypothetical protein [Streptomyces sp. NPDC090022]|uniref:hypothetical protein n=1 Tax=Streptomyces sp. NPDC090022 TaxID=3365920 RepID=UPI0037FD0E93
MLPFVLAAAVYAAAAAVYAAIGLWWWRRARVRREILRIVAALDLAPYDAAVLRKGASEAAAAELVLDGYLRIDAEGAAFLTERGRDVDRTPAHPAPAALLEAVRRHDPEPVSIGWLDWQDEAYGQWRAGYLKEREEQLPELPRMPGEEEGVSGCGSCVAVVALLCLWVVAVNLLVESRPQGVLEWAAAVLTGLGLVSFLFADDAGKAARARTECGEALEDRIRAVPHPALAALAEEQRRYLLRSVGDHWRWRGVDAVAEEGGGEADGDDEDDEWLDDKVWWEDAYEYRASDEEAARDPEPPGKV